MQEFIPSLKRFALIGAAGYIAPRHLKAIKNTGNVLVAAMDKSDSVGVLDSYFPGASFFTEFERFDRFLEKLRRADPAGGIDCLSIATPNYLHDAHIRFALRLGASAICEKPVVLNPWNLDALKAIEAEYGRKVYTVLQMRLHPALRALKSRVETGPAGRVYDVELTNVTARGRWYFYSWKGDEAKSGGVATNIGIHFFDLLQWLFGRHADVRVFHSDPKRMSGFIEMERAKVRWFLSVDPTDLPAEVAANKKTTYRSITVDGKEIEFSEGFTDLHTEVYRQILAGNGHGIDVARPSIQLTHQIRTAPITEPGDLGHPFLTKLRG